MKDKNTFKTISEYIDMFPDDMQEKLQKIRNVIKEAAKDATEAISWGMPTFKLNGNLIHFMAHKNHIGIYPGESPIIEFKNELSKYKTSKGAIQIPLDEPIPAELIKKIVEFRVKENKKIIKEERNK